MLRRCYFLVAMDCPSETLSPVALLQRAQETTGNKEDGVARHESRSWLCHRFILNKSDPLTELTFFLCNMEGREETMLWALPAPTQEHQSPSSLASRGLCGTEVWAMEREPPPTLDIKWNPLCDLPPFPKDSKNL